MSSAIISIDNKLPELNEQLARERELITKVRQDKQPRIHIWRAQQCLVVTKPESRLPHFEKAAEQLKQLGWPVQVRDTGGAAVPQSPDTLNLSVVYKAKEGSGTFDIDASYELLCCPIIQALANMGIEAHATDVEGSFCDGKYNLAVTDKGIVKKIVGTSQKWSADKIILSHAVILSNIDTLKATETINTFYELAGSDERKSASVVSSLQQHLNTKNDINPQLSDELVRACQTLSFN